MLVSTSSFWLGGLWLFVFYLAAVSLKHPCAPEVDGAPRSLPPLACDPQRDFLVSWVVTVFPLQSPSVGSLWKTECFF